MCGTDLRRSSQQWGLGTGRKYYQNLPDETINILNHSEKVHIPGPKKLGEYGGSLSNTAWWIFPAKKYFPVGRGGTPSVPCAVLNALFDPFLTWFNAQITCLALVREIPRSKWWTFRKGGGGGLPHFCQFCLGETMFRYWLYPLAEKTANHYLKLSPILILIHQVYVS